MVALVDDLQEGMKQLLNNISELTKAIGKSAKDFVALANPAAAFYLNLALRDLGATIGQILLPVIHQLTSIIRTFADIMVSLPQPVKDFIAAVVTTTFVFLGLRAAIWATGATLAAFRAVVILTSVGITTAAAPFVLLGAVVVGIISLFVDLGAVMSKLLKSLGFDPKSSFGLAVQPVGTSSIQGIGIEQAKKSLEVGPSRDAKAVVDAVDRNGKLLQTIASNTATGASKIVRQPTIDQGVAGER